MTIVRLFCLVTLPCVLAAAGPARGDQQSSKPARETGFDVSVKPLLTRFCIDCHGPLKQKGERRFDKLNGQIPDDDVLIDYQDILDQLNLGEMPPKEAGQPADKQRRQAIQWLTASIRRYHLARQDGDQPAVLRRLNSREYRNTIRDLLHLNMAMFDPTAGFPRDQTTDHLDNIGDTLVTSGHLLAGYLDAADRAVDKALGPLARPEPRTWSFRDNFRQQPEIDQVHGKVNGFAHLTLYDVVGADKHEGAYAPLHAFAEGVPVDGTYEIRIKAEAVNRRHPYDPKFLGTDPDEPLRLGIVAGNRRAGELHKPQPVEPLLAELDLADEQQWYTVRVHLDAGFTPRFTFRNGLMDVRNFWAKLLGKYKDQFPRRTQPGIVEARFNAIKYGKLPHIRIHEVEITGPFFEQWPTAGQRALLGDDCQQILESGDLAGAEARLLARFASRAYRRPAVDEEVDRLMKVVAARRREGRSELEAFGDGVKAALCSPGFLYLAQPDDPSPAGYALASRLSYFLWSSMPDQQLTKLAGGGQLTRPDVLRQQARRMLQDDKSNALVDGFLGSWLALRDLGATPPDRSEFRSFYHYDLDGAMRRETHLFTRHLLDNNLSIANFLDSDFTFVDKHLARHYGIDPPPQPGFAKVQLDDRRRGGLLGQASVLTVTANGVDTSPVTRGVWMLENILGTPPSPPPPDVEPLDPDIRGSKTIRDQLSKHRESASCLDCHRKIDPLGFALENYGPVGKWRESYGRNRKIDASGVLPDGSKFADIEDLKRVLLQRREQFSRALTTKLLTYACGRRIRAADRPAIDDIVARLRDKDGFRDLIEQIVLSEPFWHVP